MYAAESHQRDQPRINWYCFAKQSWLLTGLHMLCFHSIFRFCLLLLLVIVVVIVVRNQWLLLCFFSSRNYYPFASERLWAPSALLGCCRLGVTAVYDPCSICTWFTEDLELSKEYPQVEINPLSGNRTRARSNLNARRARWPIDHCSL